MVTLAQEAGRNAKLIVIPAEAQNPQELESAFIKLTKDGVGAVLFVPDAFFFVQRERIAELALRYRLPCIFTQREYASAGGLMSYGENLRDFSGAPRPMWTRYSKERNLRTFRSSSPPNSS